MWGRGPCRLNISQQLCCRISPVREFLVVKAEESENLKTTIKPPSPDKDWYLYVNLIAETKKLCRLNINNLCKRTSRKPPRFETLFEISYDYSRVHDDRGEDGHCSDHIGWDGSWQFRGSRNIQEPMKRQVSLNIIVGSKFYKVWGELDTRCFNNDTFIDYESTISRSNVESYDLTHDSTDGQVPSMRFCQKDAIPSLIDPRIILGNKIMFNLEDKTYVLSCRHYNDNFHDEPTLFKVFDPCQQSWKDLPYPPPPCLKPHAFGDLFTWGHKVFFMRGNVAHTFDPHKEKWSEIKIEVLNSEMSERFWVVAELQGFLIGMIWDRKELVAWKLDGDGIPQPYRVLHELRDIFSPFLFPEDCYLGHLDGEGRMWFVYSTRVYAQCEREEGGYVRVAVFRRPFWQSSQSSLQISRLQNIMVSVFLVVAKFPLPVLCAIM